MDATKNILRNFDFVENQTKRLNQELGTRDENNYTTDEDSTSNSERSTHNLRKRRKFLNIGMDYNSHESDNLEIDVVNDFSDAACSSDSGID
ncbi:6642_t:CDS:2, partial [Dentiscutata erythropus]